jgi:putative ABC transport system permease protein
MIGNLILGNILHRPVRTLVTMLAVGVEVLMVIIVVGLTSGLVSDSAKRIEGIGADIMVQPPSASIFMAFSGAPMPIRLGDKLGELQMVRSVAPVLTQFNSTGGLDIIYGIESESFRAVSGGFVFHTGHDLQDPNDILVDDLYARAKHVQVGQALHILEHDFHVAGIVEHGKGARLFVAMSTLQDLSGAHDKASVFFIRCVDPEDTQNVTDEVRQLLPRYEIRPLKNMISLMTSSNLPGLQTVVNVMIGLAVCIGFLVIFLTMYTTIIERTRDIGVLKALGASKAFIVQSVLSETTLLCLAGGVVGVILSYILRHVIIAAFPTLVILMTKTWIARACLIAVVSGWLGAAYPAWMASRKDPVDALAFE